MNFELLTSEVAKVTSKPDFSYEQQCWQKGFSLVMGVDEVGRGAFAGPVVVAAVVFKPSFVIASTPPKAGDVATSRSVEDRHALRARDDDKYIENCGIDDSKRLQPTERKRLASIIKKYALAWAIGEVDVGAINRVGIGKATEKAMRKAIHDIFLPDRHSYSDPGSEMHAFLLVDAFHVKYVKGIGLKNQNAIIKGDQKSLSIAAASILAKVHRDRLMEKLSSRYKRYKWGKNKGYGTEDHLQAILRYGITKHHRIAFINTWAEKLRGNF